MTEPTEAQIDAELDKALNGQIEEYERQRRDRAQEEYPDLPTSCRWCSGSGQANVAGACLCCHGEGVCFPEARCRGGVE